MHSQACLLSQLVKEDASDVRGWKLLASLEDPSNRKVGVNPGSAARLTSS